MNIFPKLMCLFLATVSIGCVNEIRAGSENNYSSSTTTLFSTTTTVFDPYVYIQFLENNTNCPMSGNVSIANSSFGKADNGVVRIYRKDFASRGFGIVDICVTGNITGCSGVYDGWSLKKCWDIGIPEGYFRENHASTIILNSSANIHKPESHDELVNFVRPDDLEGFINHQQEIGFFTNSTNEDVEKIWEYVNTHVSYRYDSDTAGMEYWKLPNETMLGWGDCEDFSNLFVSMARAYNSSLKCYSIKFATHLGAFCKLESGGSRIYSFFDQHTKIKGFSTTCNDEAKILETMNLYFLEYDIDESENTIEFVFNEKGYYSFENNSEFIKWANGI